MTWQILDVWLPDCSNGTNGLMQSLVLPSLPSSFSPPPAIYSIYPLNEFSMPWNLIWTTMNRKWTKAWQLLKKYSWRTDALLHRDSKNVRFHVRRIHKPCMYHCLNIYKYTPRTLYSKIVQKLIKCPQQRALNPSLPFLCFTPLNLSAFNPLNPYSFNPFFKLQGYQRVKSREDLKG